MKLLQLLLKLQIKLLICQKIYPPKRLPFLTKFLRLKKSRSLPILIIRKCPLTTLHPLSRKVLPKKSLQKLGKLIAVSGGDTRLPLSKNGTKSSEIKVGEEVYRDDNVATGFYNNINNLKTNLDPATDNCVTCEQFKFDHKLITEICKAGEKIPPLSLTDAEKLLHSLKPSVCDHWSISANHYINGGPITLKHFQIIVNLAISDIENTTVDEINTAHACILFKGHKKDKTLASSYRTISSCPFIAKACDTYIRGLSVDDWHDARAEVQFLGPGMSHEMGALLLSEVIHHSLNVNNKPLYALFVDARSAFDRALREILTRNLFLLGTTGNRLLYFDNRLKHRKTYIEWDQGLDDPTHRRSSCVSNDCQNKAVSRK